MARSLARLDRTGNLNRTGKQQELFSQGGFTGVWVGNDRKGATAAGFGGEGQSGGFQKGGAERAKLAILRWPLSLHQGALRMLFAVLFTDKPGQGALGAAQLAAHIAWLDACLNADGSFLHLWFATKCGGIALE